MRERWKITIWLAVVLLVPVGALAAIGSLRTTHVITVSRTTTATPEAIWALFADVSGRPRWDPALDWIWIEGHYRAGAVGQVKVADQPPRTLTVAAIDPYRSNADHISLPLGSHSQWHHQITEIGNGHRTITFRVEVTGPVSLASAAVLKAVLDDELPRVVDNLVELAEQTPS